MSAMADAAQPLRLSLLDRLMLDPEIDEARSPERWRNLMRDSVRRDLEMLLNTRRWVESWPPALGELETSLLSYGLPDIYNQPFATDAQRDAFCAQLVRIIGRFEPRFKSVTIDLLNNADPLDRTLRFRIQAVLLADVDGEPVVYDSMLDVASRNFRVALVDNG
jgi:type VI secretion system protein ImpF